TTGTTPPSAYAGMSRQPFNDHGHTLPTGRAHGLQADLLVPPLQTMQERGRDSGTSHPEGVAERDRSAVDVDTLKIEAEVVDTGKHLRGKRLVDFHEVDIPNGHIRVGEGSAHGR